MEVRLDVPPVRLFLAADALDTSARARDDSHLESACVLPELGMSSPCVANHAQASRFWVIMGAVQRNGDAGDFSSSRYDAASISISISTTGRGEARIGLRDHRTADERMPERAEDSAGNRIEFTEEDPD